MVIAASVFGAARLTHASRDCGLNACLFHQQSSVRDEKEKKRLSREHFVRIGFYFVDHLKMVKDSFENWIVIKSKTTKSIQINHFNLCRKTDFHTPTSLIARNLIALNLVNACQAAGLKIYHTLHPTHRSHLSFAQEKKTPTSAFHFFQPNQNAPSGQSATCSVTSRRQH